MRILIVDDHSVVRNGVKQTLTEEFPGAEFGEAGCAEEALLLIRQQSWDAVILDVSLPGRSGLDALKEIKSFRPKLPVLIFSMHGEERYALRVLKAGASGYITKDAPPDLFAEAIRKIVSGRKFVSEKLSEAMVADLTGANGTKSAVHALSDREHQILSLIGSGKSVKEIALQLSLSVKTVSTYRTRLLDKLSLNTTTALVSYAIQQGVVD